MNNYIYCELYYEWFDNTKFWFDKNIDCDKYLSNKYYKYCNKCYIDNFTKQELIGSVILLDQIPRHYKRYYKQNINVNLFSKKATYYSDLLLKLFDITTFTMDELCFIYLPYRHINDIEKIKEIINLFIVIYKNARDSYVKYRTKKFLYYTLNNSYKYINKISIKNNDNNIYDFDDNILENKGFNFKRYNSSIYNTNIYKTIYDEFLRLNNNSCVVISLSGGVDSNVSLFIANIVNNNLKYKNITLIAIHINYNNKFNSYEELYFVKKYCYFNNVKLIYRNITEINRNQCINSRTLRNIYEDITKKIRFDMYNYALNYSKDVYVFLGHNKDDCFENIITNIINKKNYENLSGMMKFTKMDKIYLWRPLLDITKSDIINLALDYNIPYLNDSTPKWSMRGKIRDNIKTSLINLNNDKNVTDNFFDLKDYLANSNEIIDNLIIDNLVNKVIDNKGHYSNNEIKSFKYFNICYLYFKKLKINISNKTIKEFITFIFKEKNNCKIFINKNTSITKKFSKDNNILEFHFLTLT